LKNALSGAAEDPSANGELGLLEAHEGDWHAALEHLNRAWTLDRSNMNIALELARAYARMDRPSDALQLLNSIGPSMRESSAFHFELAQVYTQLHRPAEARAEREALSSLEAQRHGGLLRFENSPTYVY